MVDKKRSAADTQAESPNAYPARKARQGDIVLDTRGKRIAFVSTLVVSIGAVVVLASVVA